MHTNQLHTERHEFLGLIRITEKEVDICGVILPRNQKPPFNTRTEESFPNYQKDKRFLDLLRRLAISKKHGHHVCFMSPPGVGKTDVLEYFGFLLNIPVHILSCSEDTRAAELEGKYVPNTKDEAASFEDKISLHKRSMLKEETRKILELADLDEKKLLEERYAIERQFEERYAKDSTVSYSYEEQERLVSIRKEIDTLLLRRNKEVSKSEGWNMENMEWVYAPGVLPRAIEENALLILDEWNKVAPGVRELLNAVTAKPNNPNVYGQSKFVSYANGGGEYKVGDQFLVMAAVNTPDIASGRFEFHEAEMRRFDLQILDQLTPEEAARRNIGKRFATLPPAFLPDTKELTKDFTLALREKSLPFFQDHDADLLTVILLVEAIIPKIESMFMQLDIRQDQKITLVGVRDIIYDFIFGQQFHDFTQGILFAIEHYFVNKIMDPKLREETRVKVKQIITVGEFKNKIDAAIKAYEAKSTFSPEILQKIDEIKQLLKTDDLLKGIKELSTGTRTVYSTVSQKEKIIDGELEFLEDISSLEGRALSWFQKIEESIHVVQQWEKNRKRTKSYRDFSTDIDSFLNDMVE